MNENDLTALDAMNAEVRAADEAKREVTILKVYDLMRQRVLREARSAARS